MGSNNFMGNYENTLYRYDLTTKLWAKVLTTGPQPAGRAETVACQHGKNVYIFGGYTETSAGSKYHQDGLRLYFKNAHSPPRWFYLESSSSGTPSARAGHSVVADDSNVYYMEAIILSTVVCLPFMLVKDDRP